MSQMCGKPCPATERRVQYLLRRPPEWHVRKLSPGERVVRERFLLDSGAIGPAAAEALGRYVEERECPT